MTSGDVRSILRDAMRLHQSGQFLAASDRYKTALTIDPHNSTAIHYLGLVALQLGQSNEAIRLIERSIALAPSITDFRHNLAASYLQLGETQKAIGLLDDLTREHPHQIKNHVTLGECHLRSNDQIKALGAFKRALNIDSSNQLVRLTAAELALATGDLAGSLELLKDYSESETDLRYWSLKTLILETAGKWHEAVEALEKLTRQNNANLDLLVRLGVARQNTGNWRGALAAYDEVLAQDPSHAVTLRNRAVVLRALGRIDESIDTAKHSVYLEPLNSDFHFVLGASYRESREFLKAAICFDRSAELKPNNYNAEREGTLSLLQAGVFDQAWRRHETRHRWDITMPERFVRPARPNDYWSNPFDYDDSSSMVITGEQGVGDEIMFGSVVPELLKKNRDLLIQVDRRLQNIFARSFPNSTVITHQDETPYRPIRLRMGSLPFIFRKNETDFESTPSPYLIADPKKIDLIKLKIGEKRGVICGLSWKTINPFEQTVRSIDVRDFCRAIKLQNVSYINLQYDTSPEELAVIEETLGEQFLGNFNIDLFEDLDGVASLIGCCDIVITIPNSVAHLAGALGTQTLALTPYLPSWRWLGDSTRCLWYKNVTLLRQSHRNDWRVPLSSAKARLAELCGAQNVSTVENRFHADHLINRLLENVEALTEQGNHAVAEEVTQELLRSNPTDAVVIKARSSQLFLAGEYGTATDLLSRIPAPSSQNSPPRWDGKPFDGVLVVGLEPHLGEELLIGALLLELVKIQKRVIAEVDGRILPIFRRSIPDVRFVARGERLGPIVSTLSSKVKVASSVDLLGAFMRDPQVAQRTPWIKPDTALTEKLRERYRSLFPNRRLVGLSWRSGRVLNARELKSIPLTEFAQAINSSTDAFISIQHGEIDREIAEFESNGNSAPYVDNSLFVLHSIEQLAAQLAALDIIVTVSNSTAHLACGLGRDTRVIVPTHYPILWHWGKPGVKNPWYPTATVIRADMTDARGAIDQALSARITG